MNMKPIARVPSISDVAEGSGTADADTEKSKPLRPIPPALPSIVRKVMDSPAADRLMLDKS